MIPIVTATPLISGGFQECDKGGPFGSVNLSEWVRSRWVLPVFNFLTHPLRRFVDPLGLRGSFVQPQPAITTSGGGEGKLPNMARTRIQYRYDTSPKIELNLNSNRINIENR